MHPPVDLLELEKSGNTLIVRPVANLGEFESEHIEAEVGKNWRNGYKPDAPASEPVTARSTRWRVGLGFVPYLTASGITRRASDR